MGEGAALGQCRRRPSAHQRRHRAGEGEEIEHVIPARLEEPNPESRTDFDDLISNNLEIPGSLTRAPRNDGGTHTAGFGSPDIVQAARSVLTSRHATVIWPTPPGTGVIAPATSDTSA